MYRIQSCLASRCITFLAILGLVSLVRVSANQTVNQPSGAFEVASITYQTERTDRGIVSRQLSEAEGQRLRVRTGGDVSVNSVTPSQQQLNWFTLAATPQLDAAPQNFLAQPGHDSAGRGRLQTFCYRSRFHWKW